MRITIKLFAILKDRAGVSELSLDLPEGATVEQASDQLAKTLPQLRADLARVAYAINREYALRDATLKSDDELALIPPVSGGAA